jgi:hypothetical protein
MPSMNLANWKKALVSESVLSNSPAVLSVNFHKEACSTLENQDQCSCHRKRQPHRCFSARHSQAVNHLSTPRTPENAPLF